MDKKTRWTLAFVLSFAIVCLWAAKWSRPARVRAQEAAVAPAPSPTPVDQHWRVLYGEIDTLEIRLHELNKENVYVNNSLIKLSADGKRYVILYSEDECDPDVGDDCGP